MSKIERVIVTVPSEVAVFVRRAVENGEYRSSSEVVGEALCDWKAKRTVMADEQASLRADIDKGLADAAAGRAREFDASRIIKRGRRVRSARSSSE